MKNFYFHSLDDSRGKHIKYFSDNDKFTVSEGYATSNKKNVIRGFHRSGTQNKLIQVLNGKARIVVVDNNGIRIYNNVTNSSPAIYVPIGTYVGYRSIEDNTIVNYLAEGNYKKEEDYAISPFSFCDMNEMIWGENIDNIIISERDRTAPLIHFSDLE